jgi:hypothetical protein
MAALVTGALLRNLSSAANHSAIERHEKLFFCTAFGRRSAIHTVRKDRFQRGRTGLPIAERNCGNARFRDWPRSFWARIPDDRHPRTIPAIALPPGSKCVRGRTKRTSVADNVRDTFSGRSSMKVSSRSSAPASSPRSNCSACLDPQPHKTTWTWATKLLARLKAEPRPSASTSSRVPPVMLYAATVFATRVSSRADGTPLRAVCSDGYEVGFFTMQQPGN